MKDDALEHFPYKHAAIFANEVAAMNIIDRLQEANFPDMRYVVLKPDENHDAAFVIDGNSPRHKAIRDAVYGSTGGAIGAAVASLAATSLKVAAFVGHPFAVSMAAIGYGTLLGGTGGALYGGFKGDAFLQALESALAQGHWAIVVHSADKETDQAVSQLLEQTFTEDIYESA